MAMNFLPLIVVAVGGTVLLAVIGVGIYFAVRPKDDEGGE